MAEGYDQFSLPVDFTTFPRIFQEPLEKISTPPHEPVKSAVEALPTQSSFADEGKRNLMGAGRHHTARPSDSIIDTQTKETPQVSLPSETAHKKARIGGFLPRPQDAVEGHIPINKDNQRLDIQLRVPSKEAFYQYRVEFPIGSTWPCRHYHLAGKCLAPATCRYGHIGLSSQNLFVMSHQVKRSPCKRGSSCRELRCPYGHVCQNDRCLNNEMWNCSLQGFHDVDPTAVGWVQADEQVYQ